MPIFTLVILSVASYALATPIKYMRDPDSRSTKIFSKRSGVDDPVDTLDNGKACTDFHDYFCDKKVSKIFHEYDFEENLRNIYDSTMDELFSILSTEPKYEYDHDLSLERKFFRSCMNLGEEVEEAETDAKNFEAWIDESSEEKYFEVDVEEKVTMTTKKMFTPEVLFKKILKIFGYEVNGNSWQVLDEKLAALGFKRHFFDISIDEDLERPGKNIIVLRPPSIKEYNTMGTGNLLYDMFLQMQINANEFCTKQQINSHESSSEDYSLEDYTDVAADIDENCKEIPISLLTSDIHEPKNRVALIISDEILRHISNGSAGVFKKEFKRKLSIHDFGELYQSETGEKETAKIDWLQIIESVFEPFNIDIEKNKSIYVENVPYFKNLAKILGDHSDEELVNVIKTGLITANLRYFDWKWTSSVDPISKKSFCLGETKFYSSSAKILSYIRLDMVPYARGVKTVFQNVIAAFRKNITEDPELPLTKRVRLLSELKTLGRELFVDHGEHSIPTIYKDFHLSGKYIVDTNNLKRLLKNKLLNQLDTKQRPTFEPFSIIDMDNIRNRLTSYTVMSAQVYDYVFQNDPFNVEVHYATFGVNLAGFIHALLIAKRDEIGHQGFNWFTPRDIFLDKDLKCFEQYKVLDYTDLKVVVKRVYSIYFAYQAMMNADKNSSVKSFFQTLVDRLCSVDDKEIVQTSLLNLSEFASAFKCQQTPTKCRVTPFS